MPCLWHRRAYLYLCNLAVLSIFTSRFSRAFPQCSDEENMVEGKTEKSSVFPYSSAFLNPLVPMHCSIVKHDKGILCDMEGEIVQETDNFVCRHPLGSGESLILVVMGNHAENIESCDPLGRNEHILSVQLPAVWYISFRTGVAFICIIERDAAFTCLVFKFLHIHRVAARVLPLGVFLYAYILRQC